MSAPTHYAALGVAPESSIDAIRAVYLARVLVAHPDKGGDAAEFQRIQGAWEVLSDPALRQAYDAGLTLAAAQCAAAAALPLSDAVPVAEFLDAGGGAWTHACRCGDAYSLSLQQLQEKVGLVNCGGCSLVVRIVY